LEVETFKSDQSSKIIITEKTAKITQTAANFYVFFFENDENFTNLLDDSTCTACVRI